MTVALKQILIESLGSVRPPKIEVDEFTIMARLNLTLVEAAILNSIWLCRNNKRWMHKRSTRQHIYTMRRKLAPYSIELLNLGDGWYGIPQPSRDILTKLFSNC